MKLINFKILESHACSFCIYFSLWSTFLFFVFIFSGAHVVSSLLDREFLVFHRGLYFLIHFSLPFSIGIFLSIFRNLISVCWGNYSWLLAVKSLEMEEILERSDFHFWTSFLPFIFLFQWGKNGGENGGFYFGPKESKRNIARNQRPIFHCCKNKDGAAKIKRRGRYYFPFCFFSFGVVAAENKCSAENGGGNGRRE